MLTSCSTKSSECGREALWAPQPGGRRDWQEAGPLSCKGQHWGLPFLLSPSSEVTFLLVFPCHRSKGARTITFAEFQEAMKELCTKRFKGKSPEEALQAVYGLFEGKEPGSAGTTVSRSFLSCSAP